MRRRGGRRARIGWNGGERTRLSDLPHGGIAAALAISQNAIVGGDDVGFDTLFVNAFERQAHIADQNQDAEFLFFLGRRRKFHLPEILNVIKKRNAVRVDAGVLADLADHADFRFFIAVGPAKDHLLLGGEFVLGKEAGAVKAEENGLRLLGKNPAGQIGTDQDDGNLFGDASASAHNLLGQNEGHNADAQRSI